MCKRNTAFSSCQGQHDKAAKTLIGTSNPRALRFVLFFEQLVRHVLHRLDPPDRPCVQLLQDILELKTHLACFALQTDDVQRFRHTADARDSIAELFHRENTITIVENVEEHFGIVHIHLQDAEVVNNLWKAEQVPQFLQSQTLIAFLICLMEERNKLPFEFC